MTDFQIVFDMISEELDEKSRLDECIVGPPPTIETVATEQQGWIPKGETLEFKGRKIPGMVYFGKPETFECGRCKNEHDSGVYINPVLPVNRTSPAKRNHFLLSYSYHAMSPGCRSLFLDWHASGRSDLNCNLQFPLNYLMGLERRFFKDEPTEQERREILEEVDRLHRIFGRNNHFDFKVKHFKKFATVTGAISMNLKESNAKSYGLMLKAREEWEKSGSDLPLGAQECQRIFKEAMELGLIRNPNIDPYPEQLFSHLFDRNFPKGIDIEERRKPFGYYYRSCSDEFSAKVPTSYNGSIYYEFKKLRKQFKIILDYGTKVLRLLDEYAEFLKKHPEKADSFDAVKNLPVELWGMSGRHRQEIEEHLNGLADWARKQVESGTPLRAGDVSLNSNREIWKERLNCDLPGDLSEPLALCGYGIAQDYCLRYQPEQEDELVMIYEMRTENGLIDKQSDSYSRALTEFAVGAYVLNAESRPAEESEKLLFEMISKREDLTENERNRLKANMKCVLAVPHDKAFMRRLKKEVKDEWKPGICQFLVSLAHMEGMANAKTVSTIEKIYPKLGLNPADAYADLHAGKASSAEKQGKGNGSQVTEMDDTRIESIKSDTRKVSEVLGGIFTAQDEAKEAPEAEEGRIQFSGLDTKHATFLQKLLEREYWTLDEFEELARYHGLLPVGAVETINEWMFEKFEEPLLDEQEGFHLSPGVAGLLKPELDAKL